MPAIDSITVLTSRDEEKVMKHHMDLGAALKRITWMALKAIGGFFAFLAIGLFGLHIWSSFLVHQVSVHCFDFAVYFKGPKNDKYIEVIAKIVADSGEPYEIRNHEVFSTAKGVAVDQIDKVIQYAVRPEWNIDAPKFKDAEEERIVRIWQTRDRSSINHDEYCHFLEAAISRNGIDAEARRQNPRVWPPHKWYVPPE